jgi:hypothetical protein
MLLADHRRALGQGEQQLLAHVLASATITRSNSTSDRRRMSTWPWVMGSNDPGKIGDPAQAIPVAR